MRSRILLSFLFISTIGYAPFANAQSSDPFAQMDADFNELMRQAEQKVDEAGAFIQKTTTQTSYRVTENGTEVRTETTYTITTTTQNSDSTYTYSDVPSAPNNRPVYRAPQPVPNAVPANAQPAYPSGSRSQISYRVPDTEPSVVPNATRPATSAPAVPTQNINTATYYALLTDYEKSLYHSLYQAATGLQPKFTVAGDLDSTIISRIVRAVINDHPELVWMKEGYGKGITLVNNQITETDVQILYNDLAQDPSQAIKSIEAAAAPILKGAKKYNTPEAQEKYIHDYLLKNIKYIRSTYDQNTYGALVSKEAVCAGIARAYKYLLDQLNIPSYVVTGQMIADGDAEPHAWNLVVLNGRCYNVDVTSDEVEVVRGKKRYTKIDDRLFNKSDAEFRKLGYVRESEYSDEAIKLPECK